MKSFTHVNANTVKEVVELLKRNEKRGVMIAGGTDLLGILKDRILPHYPEVIINLKTIPGLDYIEEDTEGLKIGALARLDDIAKSQIVGERYGILADAARAVASPQVRNLATIGGNLCQDVRCMYYRYSHQIGGRILCKRKGGGACLAARGENRYGAIMGAKGCFAVCPSDMAVALAAMKAYVKVTGGEETRSIQIKDFYTPSGNVLGASEVITECRVPYPLRDEKCVFLKFRLRDSIDFAIASVASSISVVKGLCKGARIVLGAVSPALVRAREAEAFLKEKVINETIADQAAAISVEKAVPVGGSAYKLPIVKTLIKRSIMAAASG